jgi:hypothetical protein
MGCSSGIWLRTGGVLLARITGGSGAFKASALFPNTFNLRGNPPLGDTVTGSTLFE